MALTKVSTEALCLADELISKYLSTPLYLYLREKLGLLDQDEVARLRVGECLKLLCLILDSKGNAPISAEIDAVWHLLIIETAEYEKLCMKLPAAKFIHHYSVSFAKFNSNSPSSKRPEKKDLLEKISWFISYHKSFGDFYPETLAYWPISLEIMKDLKLDLKAFNKLLAQNY